MIAKAEGIAWKAPDGEQVSFGVAAAKTICTSAGPVPHLMVKFPVLQSDAIECGLSFALGLDLGRGVRVVPFNRDLWEIGTSYMTDMANTTAMMAKTEGIAWKAPAVVVVVVVATGVKVIFTLLFTFVVPP